MVPSSAPFSTRDIDWDAWPGGSCSKYHGGDGGWWFENCADATLNGKWATKGMSGMYWASLTSDFKNRGLTSSRMLVGGGGAGGAGGGGVIFG